MPISSSTSLPMKVVVAGGGVAGFEAILALHSLAGDSVDLTLLAPEHDFVYRPLSVGQPFALGEARSIPITRFASDLGINVKRDALASVNARLRTVTLDNGDEVHFDKLIVATGADRVPAFAHVQTFRGAEDAKEIHGLILDVEGGYSRKIAFVVPDGVAWSLPLYELALMTAQRAKEMSVDVDLTFVTPEDRPLGVFGAEASQEVQQLLADAGITVRCRSVAEVPSKGRIVMHPGGEELVVERIVALPRIGARVIPGLEGGPDGFLPIDRHARVGGSPDIYAAGDGTDFPLKQGGIACQQADAAAEHIARDAGIPLDPKPLRPVLRGKLLTGGTPRYISHDVSAIPGGNDQVSEHMLWWPPTKVAGRYLSPYLAGHENRNVSDTGEELGEVELRGYEFAAR